MSDGVALSNYIFKSLCEITQSILLIVERKAPDIVFVVIEKCNVIMRVYFSVFQQQGVQPIELQTDSFMSTTWQI